MKHTALLWIAAVSALALLAPAARRPRYGGKLRIEMRAAPRTLDPAESAPGEFPFYGAVFENLIRLDSHGDPQPWLATAWTHDVAKKCWVFTPRTNVVLHDGSIWTSAPIEIADDWPIGDILRELSRPKNAIVVHTGTTLSGTGPFRIVQWEAGISVALAAHDRYWQGRPFLDSVEIQFGRDPAEQAADFQLAKAEAIEGQIAGKKAAAAEPDLIALQIEPRVPDAVREAIALSIDRGAIHNVILQKQGEPAHALLPQWLSGYAFLFQADRNVARARQLAAGAAPLAFSYDMKDMSVRALAQRIEVNARDAGIMMRPSPGGQDVRLVKFPIASRDPIAALEEIAALTKFSSPAGASSYELERALLDGHHLIPIVHIPKMWTISPRIHGWPRGWPQLAEVWME
jgi:ABC-type transport system substrate-binding protein